MKQQYFSQPHRFHDFSNFPKSRKPLQPLNKNYQSHSRIANKKQTIQNKPPQINFQKQFIHNNRQIRQFTKPNFLQQTNKQKQIYQPNHPSRNNNFPNQSPFLNAFQNKTRNSHSTNTQINQRNQRSNKTDHSYQINQRNLTNLTNQRNPRNNKIYQTNQRNLINQKTDQISQRNHQINQRNLTNQTNHKNNQIYQTVQKNYTNNQSNPRQQINQRNQITHNNQKNHQQNALPIQHQYKSQQNINSNSTNFQNVQRKHNQNNKTNQQTLDRFFRTSKNKQTNNSQQPKINNHQSNNNYNSNFRTNSNKNTFNQNNNQFSLNTNSNKIPNKSFHNFNASISAQPGVFSDMFQDEDGVGNTIPNNNTRNNQSNQSNQSNQRSFFSRQNNFPNNNQFRNQKSATRKQATPLMTIKESEELRKQHLEETIFPKPRSAYDEGTFPKIDETESETWIYPTNYPIRNYQFNISQTALFHNTLVALPTGLGKTLIAAVVMYNYFRWFPTGKILFLAPTKPLVHQQIDAVSKIIGVTKNDGCEITGQTNPELRKDLYKHKRVFFATPQTIVNDLNRGILLANEVVCLILDEAHKATGNYDYCNIIKKVLNSTNKFRILGLSATPGATNQQIQRIIGNLMITKLEVRTDDSDTPSLDIYPYLNQKKIEEIVVPIKDNGIFNKVISIYAPYLNNLIGTLYDNGVFWTQDLESASKGSLVKSFQKFTKTKSTYNGQKIPFYKFVNLIETFSSAISLFYGFQLLLNYGLKSFFDFLKNQYSSENQNSNGNQNNKGSNKSQLRNSKKKFLNSETYQKLMHYLTQVFEKKGIESHPKLTKLKKIIVNHFRTCQNNDTRVMIFSNYRTSVIEITSILSELPTIKIMPFIGQSSTNSQRGYTQLEQQLIIEKFKQGCYNTLVSTSIGEEGLDIGEVDLIICYDAQSDPKRTVQRFGRTGRKRKGKVIILLTEGKEEKIYQFNKKKKKFVQKQLLNSKQFLFYKPKNSVLDFKKKPKLMKTKILIPSDNLLNKDLDNKRKKQSRALQLMKDNDGAYYFIKVSKKDLKKKSIFLSRTEQSFFDNHYKLKHPQKVPELSLTKNITQQHFPSTFFNFGHSSVTNNFMKHLRNIREIKNIEIHLDDEWVFKNQILANFDYVDDPLYPKEDGTITFNLNGNNHQTQLPLSSPKLKSNNNEEEHKGKKKQKRQKRQKRQKKQKGKQKQKQNLTANNKKERKKKNEKLNKIITLKTHEIEKEQENSIKEKETKQEKKIEKIKNPTTLNNNHQNNNNNNSNSRTNSKKNTFNQNNNQFSLNTNSNKIPNNSFYDFNASISAQPGVFSNMFQDDDDGDDDDKYKNKDKGKDTNNNTNNNNNNNNPNNDKPYGFKNTDRGSENNNKEMIDRNNHESNFFDEDFSDGFFVEIEDIITNNNSSKKNPKGYKTPKKNKRQINKKYPVLTQSLKRRCLNGSPLKIVNSNFITKKLVENMNQINNNENESNMIMKKANIHINHNNINEKVKGEGKKKEKDQKMKTKNKNETKQPRSPNKKLLQNSQIMKNIIMKKENKKRKKPFFIDLTDITNLNQNGNVRVNNNNNNKENKKPNNICNKKKGNKQNMIKKNQKQNQKQKKKKKKKKIQKQKQKQNNKKRQKQKQKKKNTKNNKKNFNTIKLISQTNKKNYSKANKNLENNAISAYDDVHTSEIEEEFGDHNYILGSLEDFVINSSQNKVEIKSSQDSNFIPKGFESESDYDTNESSSSEIDNFSDFLY
ncbi:fanconi anemia group m protein [Anaeramoeba flamelloides]|uniref:Fanconi anemia group m protein n=1 Tax=Anaeramoeba flamelloides TaxID=1746091 RepID=A0ABQ8XCH4_9EUKA|nr:fanconi anemia group m protein [Anaeramoeba flamelloides]